MDKAALFAMLAQQAPKLLALLQAQGSEQMLPNITSALDNGYDPSLIEQSLATSEFPMDIDNLYDPNRSLKSGFPSDFATRNDMLSVAEGLRAGQYPAEISAGSMLANDPSIGLSNLYEGSEVIGGDNDLSGILKSSDNVPGTDIPWDDRDMDALHSSEGWDDGSNYKLNPKLVAWYKKNKR